MELQNIEIMKSNSYMLYFGQIQNFNEMIKPNNHFDAFQKDITKLSTDVSPKPPMRDPLALFDPVFPFSTENVENFNILHKKRSRNLEPEKQLKCAQKEINHTDYDNILNPLISNEVKMINSINCFDHCSNNILMQLGNTLYNKINSIVDLVVKNQSSKFLQFNHENYFDLGLFL